MNWKDSFSKGKELVLATSSNFGMPNANKVISLGFIDDKILIADCYMKNTLKNLKENGKVCMVSDCYRIKGNAKVSSIGKCFDRALGILSIQDKNLKLKNVIIVTVKEIFDLNECKVVSKF